MTTSNQGNNTLPQAQQQYLKKQSQPDSEAMTVPVEAETVAAAAAAANTTPHTTQIAVLIPCYNEVQTIVEVVQGFLRELPTAAIYVYDNNSTDHSSERLTAWLSSDAATSLDALTRVHLCTENRQGKGNVVRTMFREVEADCYLMVDADQTYDPTDAKRLVAGVLEQGYDMVIGDRLSSTYFTENKRPFHNTGNVLVRSLINILFNRQRKEELITDIMTGYRAFSREFVKSCIILSKGFEIETELTVHALSHNFKILSLPIHYQDRPQGSVSKLNTFSDGFKVLLMIFNLLRSVRPLLFFSAAAGLCLLPALLLLVPVLVNYFSTGLVPKLPSFVASCVFLLLAVLSMFTGLILDTLNVNQRKLYEMHLNDLSLLDRHKSQHTVLLPDAKRESTARVATSTKKQP